MLSESLAEKLEYVLLNYYLLIKKLILKINVYMKVVN